MRCPNYLRTIQSFRILTPPLESICCDDVVYVVYVVYVEYVSLDSVRLAIEFVL